MCERDELCGNDPENCPDCNPAPNAWRVLDSEGEHRYTSYSEADAEGILAGHPGWRIVPVTIADPRW
jgi:hypothetical protein